MIVPPPLIEYCRHDLAITMDTSAVNSGGVRVPPQSSFQSHAAESMLRDSRLINSDIGRHAVKCNFSSRLTGRFYQNGSLERHATKRDRLANMKARKRRLEKEVQLEEQRVWLLEEKLRETECARGEAREKIATVERGMPQFQALVRRNRCMKLFERMKCEARMRKLVALFGQTRFRGWTGRLTERELRREREWLLKNQTATRVQARVRGSIQRRIFIEVQERRRLEQYNAAGLIQAVLRGRWVRQRFLDERSMRQAAVLVIQRQHRAMMGRIMAGHLRTEVAKKRIEKEKPRKRIPLHLRRYSTYGKCGAAVSRGSNKSGNIRDMRRRSSGGNLTLKGVVSKLGRQDSETYSPASTVSANGGENDSVASSVMSALSETTEVSRLRIGANRTPHTGSRGKENTASARKWKQTSSAASKVSKSVSKWKKPGDKPKAGPSNLLSVLPFHQSDIIDYGSSDLALAVEEPKKSRADEKRKQRERSEKFEKSTELVEKGKKENLRKGPGGAPGRISPKILTTETSNPSKQRHRKDMGTPVTISAEAAFIVGDVLGAGEITNICMANSSFEEEFNEHENDLE